MQPYFFPYIGYFQLVRAVDVFVVYDNIKFTKKGWINRNRYLLHGEPAVFTVPVAHASDSLDVRERQVAPSFERERMLHRLGAAYRHAPRRAEAMSILERCVRNPEPNLFLFLESSIRALCDALEIPTPIVVSSSLDVDPALTGQDKVLALCRAVGATSYLNPIGGRELYDAAAFAAHGMSLAFLKARPEPYPQLGAPFVPFLSILDVLMFNPPDATHALLDAWDTV